MSIILLQSHVFTFIEKKSLLVFLFNHWVRTYSNEDTWDTVRNIGEKRNRLFLIGISGIKVSYSREM